MVSLLRGSVRVVVASFSSSGLGKLWLFLVFSLSFVPKILSSVNGVIDPFTYSDIAVSIASFNQGSILVHPFEPVRHTFQAHAHFISERAVVTAVLVIFSQVTGLPIAGLQFFPLNGFVLIILSYVLAKLLTRSTFVAGIFTLFLSYEPDINRLGYNVSYIGFGFSLFFTFLILYIKTFQSPRFYIMGIPLLVITFFDMYLTYYTSEVDAILFSLAVATLTIIGKRYGGARYSVRPLVGMSIVFLMIFTMFDRIFYSTLPRVSGTGALDFIVSYVVLAIGLLLSEGGTSTSKAFEITTQYVGLSVLLSIFIPVAVYSLYFLANLLRGLFHRKLGRSLLDPTHIIYFSLIFPWFVEILVYTSRSKFPFKYFLMVFSLLSLFSVSRFRIRGSPVSRHQLGRGLLLCIILALSVAKFGAWFGDQRLGYTADSIGPVCSSMSQFVSRGEVLTDLGTGGRLLMEFVRVQKGDSVYIYPFSEDTHTVEFLYVQDAGMADELFRTQRFDYLVLSYGSISHAISGNDWLTSDPLGGAFRFPEGYPSFSKICDNSQFVVYMFTNSQHSASLTSPSLKRISEPTDIEEGSYCIV